MLTVWRTLHVLWDGMLPAPTEPPPTGEPDERNFIPGSLDRITPPEAPGKPAKYWLRTSGPPLADESKDLDDPEPSDGRFQAGRLCLGTEAAVSNTLRCTGPAVLTTDGNGELYVRSASSLSYTLSKQGLTTLSGDIKAFERAPDPPQGGLATFTLSHQPINSYLGAALTVAGMSWTVNSIQEEGVVEASGSPDIPYVLVDDDTESASQAFDVSDRYLKPNDAHPANGFALTYITPMLVPDAANVPTFVRNVKCTPPQLRGEPCGALGYVEQLRAGRDKPPSEWPPWSPDYWQSYVQVAFQDGRLTDMDPSLEAPGAALGVTFSVGNVEEGSLLFSEAIWEQSLFNGVRYAQFYEECRSRLVVHELAHQLGLTKADHSLASGFMASCVAGGDPAFSGTQQAKIRGKGL